MLCSQIAFAQAARGQRVVVATVASESQDKLLEELEGFSFYDADKVGDEIYLVSIYAALQRGPKEAKDLLLKAMRDRKATMLFVDGLRSLRDLWQNEAKLRDFLYELNVGIAQLGAIGLFTTEYRIDKLMEYPEATTVDGIVSLSVRRVGGRAVRRAQVVKLRGRAHLTSDHLMHITGDGIRMVPRIEETTEANETFVRPTSAPRSVSPMLDDMLHGGLPSKSTTLIAGSTGVGKTLLALSFVASGARRDEPGLLITYTEPVERLVARAKRVSLDVEPLLKADKLTIEYRSSVNVEADDLVEHLLRRGARDRRTTRRGRRHRRSRSLGARARAPPARARSAPRAAAPGSGDDDLREGDVEDRRPRSRLRRHAHLRDRREPDLPAAHRVAGPPPPHPVHPQDAWRAASTPASGNSRSPIAGSSLWTPCRSPRVS